MEIPFLRLTREEFEWLQPDLLFVEPVLDHDIWLAWTSPEGLIVGATLASESGITNPWSVYRLRGKTIVSAGGLFRLGDENREVERLPFMKVWSHAFGEEEMVAADLDTVAYESNEASWISERVSLDGISDFRFSDEWIDAVGSMGPDEAIDPIRLRKRDGWVERSMWKSPSSPDEARKPLPRDL